MPEVISNEDLRAYFDKTVVSNEGVISYVKAIRDDGRLALEDVVTGMNVIAEYCPEKINGSIPLGFSNLHNIVGDEKFPACIFVSKVPHRGMKVGISLEGLEYRRIGDGQTPLEDIRKYFKTLGFKDTVQGKYPSFRKALRIVKDHAERLKNRPKVPPRPDPDKYGDVDDGYNKYMKDVNSWKKEYGHVGLMPRQISIAFDRSFAITSNFGLYWRDTLIGEFKEADTSIDSFVINPEYRSLLCLIGDDYDEIVRAAWN
jgi:hypothetical protein